MKQLYHDEYYDFWMNCSSYYLEFVSTFINQYIKDREKEKLLFYDVGGAQGRLIDYSNVENTNYILIDMDFTQISKSIKDCMKVVANAESLPFADNGSCTIFGLYLNVLDIVTNYSDVVTEAKNIFNKIIFLIVDKIEIISYLDREFGNSVKIKKEVFSDLGLFKNRKMIFYFIEN